MYPTKTKKYFKIEYFKPGDLVYFKIKSDLVGIILNSFKDPYNGIEICDVKWLFSYESRHWATSLGYIS